MREPTELPPILTGDEQNQIQQLRDYLVRLAQRPEESEENSDARISAAEGSLDDLNAQISSMNVRISDLWNTIYPVGAIYISTASTSPATLFGGTWERITGRFLLAATDGGAEGGDSDASIAPGYTGGEATHTLTTAETAYHTHETRIAYDQSGYGTNLGQNHVYIRSGQSSTAPLADTGTGSKSNINYRRTANTGATGEGGAHNNMPPYLAVYVWKRTA